MPAFSADIAKSTVAIVMEENIFAALQARRTASHYKAFVETWTAFRQGRGLQVEIDVIGYIEIEMSIAIVIQKGAAGIPALEAGRSSCGYARLLSDVSKCPVTVIAI